MRPIVLTERIAPETDNIGRYSVRLARGFRAAGHDAAVWTFSTGTDTAANAPHRAFAQRSRLAKIVAIVRSLRGEQGAILVWQYNPFMYGWKGLPLLPCLLPLAVTIVARRPVFVVFHEIAINPSLDPRRLIWAIWHRLCLWLILAGCEGAVATNVRRSAELRRFVRIWLPWRARSATVYTIPVPPLIDVPSAAFARASREHPCAIGLFAASLAGRGDVFLEELAGELQRTGARVQFVVIGGEPQPESSQGASASGEATHVVHTGYLSDDTLGRTLATLDLFVVLQDQGASGRHSALTHAFAHALPVITTYGAYWDRHLFRDRDTCLLVPHADRSALLDAIRLLCSDGALRARVGQRAHETYLQHLSWPVSIDRFLEILTHRTSIGQDTRRPQAGVGAATGTGGNR